MIGEANTNDGNAREEEGWELNPTRYSKWYRVKSKGELELGLSSGVILSFIGSWNIFQ